MSEPHICGACTVNNHTHHETRGRCLNAKFTDIPTSGAAIRKTTECLCAITPDPPHDVMHTNTSPLYFPREVVAHILELAQTPRAGAVELNFDSAGRLVSWKLTRAGRDNAGFDTQTPAAVS